MNIKDCKNCFYKIDEKISELFEMYENKLTDIEIEIIGYY